jgi:hypothetical protein
MEHSIEVEVPLEFAWNHRTNIANWNDPPAQFALDGPFARGTHGTTLIPGQPPIHWTIAEVAPLQSFVIEMQLDRAELGFEWRFQALSERRTRITQRINLSGDNAVAYREQIDTAFSRNLPDGMKKIVAELTAAFET